MATESPGAGRPGALRGGDPGGAEAAATAPLSADTTPTLEEGAKGPPAPDHSEAGVRDAPATPRETILASRGEAEDTRAFAPGDWAGFPPPLTARTGAEAVDEGRRGIDTEPDRSAATVDTGPSAAPEGTLRAGESVSVDRDVPPTPEAWRPALTPPPGESRCGRYVLMRYHARGGMGEVWQAEDPAIGRVVALKRILGSRPEQVRRFEVEARVTGQLEHPGIVPIHDLGYNEEGQPFYVMKFVQGRTLQKVIREYHASAPGGGREVDQVRLLQIFVSLCQTVAYAHSRGVLHRDLKPDNVMLGPYGETILLDWGIAKVMGRPEEPGVGAEVPCVRLPEGTPGSGTRMGSILGTPSYMAPEVAGGLNSEVDERSDVYLLGGTLYEILTGRKPRSAQTAIEMVNLARTKPPAPASVVRPGVPRALDAICRKALAQRKEDRYQAALELADDVQRFLAGEPVSAHPEGPLARAWRWARRHRRALARSGAAALMLGASLFGLAKFREAESLKERDRARRDVGEVRRLADEARFFMATTDPEAEHAPYFDPRRGEDAAGAALRLAEGWGPELGRLPLPGERAPLRQELYDLILLSANAKVGHAEAGPGPARSTLALLARAALLRPPTRGFYRIRALAERRLGDDRHAAEDERRAEDPRAATSSLDHFLLGEGYRRSAARRPGGGAGRWDGEPDPALLGRALDQYRRALRIDPSHYWSQFQLGRCCVGLGRYVEGVEALGTCVALRPESPWGYGARALALARLGRYPEAELDLDRALRLGDDPRPARLTRGAVSWSRGRDEEALADFEAVLRPPASRRLIEAACYRGQLYLRRGEIEKALRDFDAVVAEAPGYRAVYLYRAQVLLALGDRARGLADLDAYIADDRAADRVGWEPHAFRGRVLRRLYAALPRDRRVRPPGRALADAALAELGEAVLAGGWDAGLLDDLGALLEIAGRPGEAITVYSYALELAPGDPLLRNKRGWARELAGRPVEALDDFAAAVRSDPENAEAHTGLGYVSARLGRPADAQREADLALLHGPDSSLVLHNVACIYAALSESDGRAASADQDAAVALLRRALALGKRQETGPSEIDLIRGEPAFRPLRQRPDFRRLIDPGEPEAGRPSSRRPDGRLESRAVPTPGLTSPLPD